MHLIWNQLNLFLISSYELGIYRCDSWFILLHLGLEKLSL